MRVLVVLVCVLLTAASCSSSGDDGAPTTETTAADTTTETTASSDTTVVSGADGETDGETETTESDSGTAGDDAAEEVTEEERVALLLEHCEAGSDIACDVLIMNTDEDSPEEAIALRCGGRSDDRVLFCTDGFEHEGRNYWFEPDDSDGLPAMVTLCEEGDMTACDFLFERSPVDSEYEAIGDGCAFRVDVAIPDCRTQLGDEFGRCPSDLATCD